MIVIGIILSFVSLGLLCWLLFALLCAQPHKSANVALQKMWRTRDKRFCGVQKPAPYATYLRVDDRCPPSSVEDRSCTTNYLSGQPLLLDIERDPMRSLASAS
jgi:hypothetical protein